jgi:hypothetical protein
MSMMPVLQYPMMLSYGHVIVGADSEALALRDTTETSDCAEDDMKQLL